MNKVAIIMGSDSDLPIVEKKQDVSFEKLDWIFHSVACRSAIKAGNFTSRLEMELFAKQLLYL